MRADASERRAVAVFLFAHQDDEFGAFEAIRVCRLRGVRVVCAFLTEGPRHSALAARRDRESRRVLASLGVAPADIVFAGTLLAIADASLAERLPVAARWLEDWLAGFAEIALACVPAWEGGHPDHDALHALATVVAHRMGLLERVRQFPLYNGLGRRQPFLNLLAPLPANGPPWISTIPWRQRLRFLRLCLYYGSQRKTWSGLLPSLAWSYLRHGRQTLQAVSLARLEQRPHDGALHYEGKGLYTWDELRLRLEQWRGPFKGGACGDRN